MKKQSKCVFKIVFWFLLIMVLTLPVVLVLATPLDNCSIGLILNIIGALITIFIAFPQADHEAIGVLVVEDGTPLEHGMTAGEMRQIGRQKCIWSRCCSILGVVCLVIGFAFQLYAQMPVK